jgi:hypothetical protein
MSSPAMADILRQGEEDIKNGLGRVIKLEDLCLCAFSAFSLF